jgi:hypothetical protein
MHVFARALRGHSWLAWLSLLFATQIAATDPVVGPDPEDGPDRAAVHAMVRSRPLPVLTLAADIPASPYPHEQTATPVVIVGAAQDAPDAGSSTLCAAAVRPDSSTTLPRLHSRAPPFFRFL